MHFSEEGAGIDGKSFSLLPVEIFYRETGKTKKVTEYPCDGKLLKAAGAGKNEISYRPWGDWFRG